MEVFFTKARSAGQKGRGQQAAIKLQQQQQQQPTLRKRGCVESSEGRLYSREQMYRAVVSKIGCEIYFYIFRHDN